MEVRRLKEFGGIPEGFINHQHNAMIEKDENDFHN